MATQTIRLNLGRLSGTFVADVYLDGSDTTFAIDAAMSAASQPGWYTFTLTSSAGVYSVIVKESSARIGSWWIKTMDTAATFLAADTRDEVVAPTTAEIFAAVCTSQMTESYAADGTAPTLAQAMFLTMQHLCDASITSTTKTVKKLDGTTTAATFTLNSATAPTSIERAT